MPSVIGHVPLLIKRTWLNVEKDALPFGGIRLQEDDEWLSCLSFCQGGLSGGEA